MTFQIGDRVKATETITFNNCKGHGDGIVEGQVYTVERLGDDGDPILNNGDKSSDGWAGGLELYAKAGEFVKGDVVMPANVVGGPWTVLDVQARDDGQRICFPGEYGQWWRADAYRLATAEEIAAGDLLAPKFSEVDPSIVIEPKRYNRIFVPKEIPMAEIPAADFDFSTIKAGDEIIVRLRVNQDGLDRDGEVRTEHGRTDFNRFFRSQDIISVIPAPKPKPLRERAIEAAMRVASQGAVPTAIIVDAVLAEVEKGR